MKRYPLYLWWPHWHHDSKRGWYMCYSDHKPGKQWGK